MSEKVYVIAIADDSDFYIPYAEHIERNDSLFMAKTDPGTAITDPDAAKVAEQDGIKLIYGMRYVPDGVYIDTPQNRAVILEGLRNFPVYKEVVSNSQLT